MTPTATIWKYGRKERSTKSLFLAGEQTIHNIQWRYLHGKLHFLTKDIFDLARLEVTSTHNHYHDDFTSQHITNVNPLYFVPLCFLFYFIFPFGVASITQHAGHCFSYNSIMERMLISSDNDMLLWVAQLKDPYNTYPS